MALPNEARISFSSRRGGRNGGGSRRNDYMHQGDRRGGPPGGKGPERRTDEDVLIAFMQLVRQGNVAAQEAQAKYQQDSDQIQFLATARLLLDGKGPAPPSVRSFPSSSSSTQVQQQPSLPPQLEEQQQEGPAKSHSSAVASASQRGPSNGSMSTTTAELDPVSALFANATIGKTSPFTTHAVISSIERASVMQPPGMVKQQHHPREATTDSSVAEQAALAALPVEGTGKKHVTNGSLPLASSFPFSLNPPHSSTTEALPQGGEPSLNLTSRLAELFAPSKGGASPFSIGIGQTATSVGHVKGGLSVDVMAATNGDSKNGGNAFGPIRSPTSANTPTTPKTPQQQQQQQQQLLQQQQLRNDQHQQENGLQHQHQEGGGEGNQTHHQQQNDSQFGPGHPFHLQQQQQPPPPHHPMMLPPMYGGPFPPGYGHHPHHPHHPSRPPFFQGPMGGFPPGLFMHGLPPPGLEGPPPASPQQQGQVYPDGRQEGPGGGGGDHHQSSPQAQPSQPSPHGSPQQQPPPSDPQPPPSDPQHQQQQPFQQSPPQQPPFHPGGGPGVGGYPPSLGGPGPPASQGGHHQSNPFPPPFFGGFPPPHLQMFGWMGMGPPPGMGGMGGLPPPGLQPQQGTPPRTSQQQQQQHHVVGQEGQQAGEGGGGGGGQQLLPPPQQQQEDRPPHSHEGLLRSPAQGLTFTSNGGAADVLGVLQFLSGETASNGSLFSPPPKPAVVEAMLVEEGAVGSIPLPSGIADGGETAAAAAAAAAEGGGADAIVIATGEGDDVKRPKRTTRNQVGKLWVMDPHSGQYVTVIRPKTNLYVQWEAPAAHLRGMIQPEVGLFRLGVSSNQNAVISKPMSLLPPLAAEGEGMEGEGAALLRGSLSFYAPRSAGTFVFRMYDAEDHIATHGTSRQFVVEVQGRDIDSNLRVIQSQFKEKKSLVAALSQLSLLLRALEPFQPSRSFPALIWSAISSAVKQLAGGSGKDENGRSRYPVQTGIANVIYAALNNRLVMSVLASQQRTFLRAAEGLWCPFNEEFYPSEAARREYYLTNWGFDPLNLPLSVIPPQVPMLLSKEMEALLPSLLPSEAFLPRREDVRTRLEAMIGSMSCFPQGTKLRVFGSSANNFGNDEADLDMCVTFPSSGSNLPTNMSSSEIIATLAEHLEAHGMAEVMPRPTARIPIVLFKDPETGLDCDISVENPLALRNTQLLKVYSGVDPRVRALAYVVKHWARKRKINNASAGTLSSYAYILLVLHFLQTRRPSPIVPNLQLLPPDWEGQEVIDPMRLRSYLPSVMVQHPIDKVEVDTYFYTPPQADFRGLNQYAARNKASVGVLLIEFFRYYAWEFDYREHVVSVRTVGVVKKDEKAEEDCWPVNQRMAVQDPFETWYNVTHFLKEGRHRHIRTEFARAYTLCVEEAAKVAKGQGGQAVGEGVSDLLKRICEEAFDAVVKKSTMEDEEAMVAAAVVGEGKRRGEGLVAEDA